MHCPFSPLVSRHGEVPGKLCAQRVKPGGTASGPRPEQTRATLCELRVWSLQS